MKGLGQSRLSGDFLFETVSLIHQITLSFVILMTLCNVSEFHLCGKELVMKKPILICLLIALMACEGNKSESVSQKVEETSAVTSHHSASITKVFNAHGGFDKWASMKQLSYEMGSQKTLVELQSRYTRLESENQTVGFDGENVWVNPPSENAARQRMSYNLMFYFYAFPFVIGDPGISYEDVEPKEILGKRYNGVKVSYGDGVGNSPKDNYIIYSDTETNKMAWLMYTATFGGDSASDRWGLIKYDQWQDVNGLSIPSAIQWYQYRDGKIGDMRNEVVFRNVTVSEDVPSMDNFNAPEGAQVISSN